MSPLPPNIKKLPLTFTPQSIGEGERCFYDDKEVSKFFKKIRN